MDIKLFDFDEFRDDEDNVISADEFDASLPGHNNKTFVRCDSEIFFQMFDEIKFNPNCSYVTYLNDFIRNDYDGEDMPISTISCFKKDADHNEIEETVSRLANVLGLPTTYVVNVPGDSVDERKKKWNDFFANCKVGDTIKINEGYILSVDFIGSNEHFDTLDIYSGHRGYPSFDILCDKYDDLRTWYAKIVLAREDQFINPITKAPLTSDVRLNLFKEFIPQYFFRRYIVKDRDLRSENVGIIYNSQTGEYKLAPIFDTEYSFNNYNKETFEKTLANLQNEMNFAFRIDPYVMNNFVTKVWDTFHSNTIDENWLCINGHHLPKKYKEFILHSLDDFVDNISTYDMNN